MLGAYYSPEYESGKVCLNKICYTDVQPVCRHDNAPDREVCLGLGTCMAGRCVYEEKDGTLKVLHKPVPESFSCKSASDCPM
jgi:hypothetical protein